MDEPATEEWIRERWGGFDYLLIARNENFMLQFSKHCLWLRYDSETEQAGCLLLIQKWATRQQVIDAERFFGCIK